MPGSTVSVFGEPDDYEAALRADGEVDLLVTGRGEFRARLTRIALDRMSLVSGEETLPRIAFISLGPRMVRVSRSRAGVLSPIRAQRPGRSPRN